MLVGEEWKIENYINKLESAFSASSFGKRIASKYRNFYIKIDSYLFMTNLVVRTQVKEILKESGLGLDNLSGDFMETLDEKVKQLILDAAKRAKENGRRTIMGKDV